ncbi:GDP-mannose 4,6-dehydratase [Mucilaginibacter sp. HMF5004]|uniref:hypothetical protein n=1 Tax=Mucilaginibacter rivuli TaxID=2857527 RepID=UPI001C5DDEB5|nr:hypothetical protein [Mucilaginibacter rivuli]MBW4888608.1 GDP-mannose 4,6-dehydratase [Mucilaginibacter rivuli]
MVDVADITANIARVALGRQVCVYIPDLSAESGYAADMTAVLKVVRQDGVVSGTAMVEESVSLREFVRQCFYELGITIEFSGKGLYEKGVIIDTDEDTINAMCLDTDIFRFGETVVRVKV